MTIKQKKFADAYIKSGNATWAAEFAGYSKKTARFIGSENLTKPNIKAYVELKMQEIEDKQIAKAEEVLKHLTSMMRGEIKEEVVVVENIGDYESKAKIVEKQASAKERIRAAELLGRRYALFTDKMEVEGNIGAVIIDDVPDGHE